jgi:hypothetical protein
VSHLHAAQHAFEHVGGGRLVVLDVADVALVDAAVRHASAPAPVVEAR